MGNEWMMVRRAGIKSATLSLIRLLQTTPCPRKDREERIAFQSAENKGKIPLQCVRVRLW
jgi:hypothetical protein